MLKPVPRRSRPNPGRVIIADTTAAGELVLPSSLAAGSGMTLSRPRSTEKEESTTPPTPEMTLVAPVASSPTCCPTRPRKRAGADNAAGEDGTFVADSGSGDRSWVLHGVYDQSKDDVRPYRMHTSSRGQHLLIPELACRRVLKVLSQYPYYTIDKGWGYRPRNSTTARKFIRQKLSSPPTRRDRYRSMNRSCETS